MMDKKDAIDYLLYMKHDVLANSPYDVALDTAIEALKETAKQPKTNGDNLIIMPVIPITVKVIRHSEWGNGSKAFYGFFVSKVYAIRGNEFLVYDDGENSCLDIDNDGGTDEGFCWVDFTERVEDITAKRCRNSGEFPIIPVVTLTEYDCTGELLCHELSESIKQHKQEVQEDADD